MNTVSIEVAKELYELGWRKECHNFLIGTTIYCSDLWDRKFYNEPYRGG